MKKFWEFFQWLLLIGFIIAIAFILNSYRYLIYALIVASVLYFLLRKIIAIRLSKQTGSRNVQYSINGKPLTLRMRKLTTFVVLLLLVYIMVVSVFSVSPGLERKEFMLTHPNWVAVTPSIRNLSADIQRGKTKYAYINLEYQFTAGGDAYTQKIHKAEKQYSFFPIIGQGAFEAMRIELLTRAKKKNVDQEYILFYNPQDPEQQQFFLANDSFYLQRSLLCDILFVYGVLFLAIVIIMLLFKISSTRRMKNQIR
ncbi:hypothetical protein BWD42_04505 [Sphingobacterium sp. CZ-UAM]|uniref:DUF3592 domain-containing protein n=1 Tax=Sphingobacterium sp. CZ-UAM TaxID=1933868 RepID=UPI0009879D48|nr:hypothetical protein [Sphingobacterium sp. CZ-UAM]OOG19214.1 hypothetical protein BWD42_04505 [Sphingobacterium sp. CZ-UAM]